MSDRLDSGTIVDGRYRVTHRLGSGGMADVYCAEDLQLGRQIALKLLYRRFAEDAEFVERFRREASSAAGLQHPNVVSVYDRGEYDGTYYIAMEFLDGRSLKTIVQQEAPLEPRRAVELIAQILRAARFAHKRGVIHRDLKPHNVIVDAEGRAKVTDFGIARAGASDMTQTGSIMGTAQYLSPEQAQGLPVSAQSDLYSVGIMLYELLTGRVPFAGDSAVAIALKQVNEAPVPPSRLNPAVSPALDRVVLRALEKDPARRYQDADELTAALTQVVPLAGPPTASDLTAVVPPVTALPVPPPATGAYEAYGYPATPPPEVVRGDGRRWWVALLAGVLVAGAIVAAVLLLGASAKVAVPNVVGVDQLSAETRLHHDGYATDAISKTSDQPAGRVIGQDPPAKTLVKKGATVTLTISGGPGQVTIPAVTGMGRRAARKALSAAGFAVSETEENSDDVPHDHVIRSSPDEGQRVDKGSAITMVVSLGPADVEVPSVVGQDVDAARSSLTGAGFTVTVVMKESDDKDPGTVLQQDPPAGKKVQKGADVTLTVAKKPDKVAIPDIVGKPDDEAIDALSTAGFRIASRRQDVDDPAQDGVVLSEDPPGGKAVMKGAQVRIVIGHYVAPPVPTETTPAPTDTTTTPPDDQ